MEALPKTAFRLGRCCTTHGVALALQESGQSAQEFLRRHHALDQGDLCDEDNAANEAALETKGRICQVTSRFTI